MYIVQISGMSKVKVQFAEQAYIIYISELLHLKIVHVQNILWYTDLIYTIQRPEKDS